jgi:hypothetical protein
MSAAASTDTPDMHVHSTPATVSIALRCTIALLIVFVFASESAPQVRIPEWFKRVPVAGISEAEAGQGIKEALAQGVTRAVLNLHKTDGFFGSSFYKMLLPPDSAKAEGTLRRIGLGSQVDKAILAINRGAEDAVGTAGPIFTQAIKEMTVADALGIVKGQKDGATQYFRRKTSADLATAFAPSVRASLEKTHATKYYGDIASGYNRFPFASGKIDPDLTSYVVGKAVDALFDQIAKEEADIRANPVARTTDILKKVFGG